MIIIKLKDQLGNQMFAYAAAKTLSIKKNLPLGIQIENSYYVNSVDEKYGHTIVSIFDNLQNEYVEKIPANYKIYKELPLKKRKNQYWKDIEQVCDNTIIDGHFLSYKYFDAYIAEIKYDPAIFEITNLEGIGNWETPMINEGKMIATTKDGECVTTKQEIAKITFVAKADVVNTTSEITLENFEASNTETILPTESKKVQIGNNQTDTNENTNEEQNETYNTIEVGEKNNNPNTTSNLKLPYAGLQKTIIPISIVIIAIIVGIVYYKRHKKNDE